MEGHLPVFKALQPTVADGNAKDIAAEIVEGFFSAAGVAAVNHPFCFPDRSRNLLEQAEFFQASAKFAAEDFAQGKTGNQERRIFGGDPVLSIARESARSD